MRTYRSALLSLVAALALVPVASAQDSENGGPPEDEVGAGLRFNGLGRAYIQQSDFGGTLADTDTTTVQTLADGEFVLDLAINGQPNRVTEVQGVLRLRNEFGGFFGSGVTVEVRELWARGIVADAIEYRVGDMDLALTPYTVHLPDRDGTVNTPEVFMPQKEVIDYEEFYTGNNERRLQGGRVDFGLAFDQVVEELDVRTFLARLRPTDFQTTPTRLIGGGRVGLTSSTFGPTRARGTVGVNLTSTWDDLESGNANDGIRNHVLTFDGALTVLDQDALELAVVGEGGRSIARQVEEPSETEPEVEALRESDTFFDLGLAVDLKGTGVNAAAHFVNVGPDFFSVSAQSKRVDYTRARSQYNRLGNERTQRSIGLFDLSRDPAVYTYRVEEQLMAYDPRYNNVLPYGRATANRRGVRLEADYAPESGVVDAGLLVAALREIRGQGTDLLKDFILVRGEADVPVAPLVGYGRELAISLGAQYENTSRGGDQFETVDLSSFLVEAGITAEVYDRLDLLLGTKVRQSDGRDYIPQIENFNDVRDFPSPFVTNDGESLIGAGLRYRFRDDVYLTIQFQQYRYGDDATPADDYQFNQVFALYSMSF